MAAVYWTAETVKVALSAATAKTVLQIVAPTNQRVRVLDWGVFFDGVSPTAQPVECVLMFQTTAGTMSALTPVQTNGTGATVQTTAQYNATVEPAYGSIVDVSVVHPQTGYELPYALGHEIIVPGGSRLAIVCTAPATVNVRAKMRCEE